MTKKITQKVLWRISEKMMRDRGWIPANNPIEFDRNIEDSQIVLIKEDIEETIKYLNKEGYVLMPKLSKEDKLIL